MGILAATTTTDARPQTSIAHDKPSAAAKVLNVLGAFTPEARSLTLTQIARRSGLALSTAHRIVAEQFRLGSTRTRTRRPVQRWSPAVLARCAGPARHSATRRGDDDHRPGQTRHDPERRARHRHRHQRPAGDDGQRLGGCTVRDPDGNVVAAVSLGVHAGTHDPASLGKLVATAARGISRSLAGPPVLQPARRAQPAA